jgi:hypothetical protein
MKYKNVVYFVSMIFKNIYNYSLKLYNKVFLNKELILKELYLINEKLNVICVEIELLKEKD